MNILVTGSSGRVGSTVVKELLGRGHNVRGFDLKAQASVETPRNFSFVQGSLYDAGAVAKAAEGIDAVLHIGAFMSWKDADSAEVYRCNVEGTFRLLEALDKKRLGRLVFISTGEVYPEGNPAYQPVDEHHPLAPLSFYGASKLLAEDLVQHYGRRFKFPWTILRISHTQNASELLDPASFFSGPRFFLRAKIARSRELGAAAALAVLEPLDTAGSEQLLISRGQDGTPYKMHITDTRDTVQGILLAFESDKAPGEIFNIGFDEPVRFEEAVPEMSRLIGLPIVEARLPGGAVHYHTSNLKAKCLLGYKPVYGFGRMLEEAAAARRARQKA